LPCLLGCQKPLADAECERLLDRYTEFLVREEEPSAGPEQLAHVLEQARRTAAQDPRFEWSECSRRVRRASYECAMAAGSVDAIERCLIF
jgi:hypothetical protein